MDVDFSALLHRYLENQATPGEEWQLMHLIDGGAYQRQLEQSIEQAIKAEVAHGMMRLETFRVNQQIVRRAHTLRRGAFRLTAATRWNAAAACVAIALITGIWRYAADCERLPTNNFIGKGVFHLPDSSTILLNGDSELTYTYTSDRREIALTGEAYFYVNPDVRRPFYVRTGRLITRALGTSFSVRAYSRRTDFMVAVKEGSVQVDNDAGTRSYGVVATDEQMAVNPGTGAVIKTSLKDPPVLEWKKAFLILDDVTLKEAGELIEARYGAKITFRNPELGNCEVTAKFFHNDELTTVLDVVTSALRLTYTVEHGDAIIDGKGCE